MDKRTKLWSIISYVTWIGWIIAFVKHDKDDGIVRRHLNQALVLNVIETISRGVYRMGGIFTTICTVVDLACLVLSIMGIVRAAKKSGEPLPIIGSINWLG